MERAAKKFKTVPVKGGKQYVEVRERVQYLATDFDGDYSIITEYQYFQDRKMWVVKATLTLEQGGITNTYTGHAQEIESSDLKQVNGTSALENCETSAVGRACAFAGIGVDIAIASADEVKKAQNRSEAVQPNTGPTLTDAVNEYLGVKNREEATEVWNKYKQFRNNALFQSAAKAIAAVYPKVDPVAEEKAS